MLAACLYLHTGTASLGRTVFLHIIQMMMYSKTQNRPSMLFLKKDAVL